MKKLILILVGISLLLGGIIFFLYKNNETKDEEVVDIFKEDKKEKKESEEKIEEIDQEKVIVDIKGMVKKPGVYEVTSDYRVNDVITEAGGLLEGADTSKINLAKIVEDEMTIIIYSSEEILEKYKNEVCICDCPEIKNDACITEETKEENKLVNINTCTIEDLMEVKGIGKSKANSIIEYRKNNGNFKSIEDIKNVSGIGESLFEKIKTYITV